MAHCLSSCSQKECQENIEKASNILLSYLDQEDLKSLPLQWYEKVFLEPFKDLVLDEPFNGDLSMLTHLELSYNNWLTSPPQSIEKLLNLELISLGNLPFQFCQEIRALIPTGCTIG